MPDDRNSLGVTIHGPSTTSRRDVVEPTPCHEEDVGECVEGLGLADRATLHVAPQIVIDVVVKRPAGIRLVASHGPLTGLLRLPFIFLAAGLTLGAGLWVAGKSRSADGRR